MKQSVKKKPKKTYSKILKYSIPTILIALIVFIVGIRLYQYANRLELIQLGNQSSSQMMGYVLKTSDNKVVVIDGGTKADTQNLEEQIKQYGGKVDAWFLTHPHKDHVGAFVEIISEESSIEIEKVYVTLNTLEWYQTNEPSRKEEIETFFSKIGQESIKEKIQEVALGQVIQIGNLRCEILGIKNPEITNNAINNSSMVIKMYINDKSLLFLGDTGVESSQKLLKNQSKEKLKATIVQMAHHGQSGAIEELYQTIKPQICLWPTPDWLWENDAGNGKNTGPWKTLETRAWIEKLKVKQHVIQKDGNCKMEID